VAAVAFHLRERLESFWAVCKGKAGLNVSNVNTHMDRGLFYTIAVAALGALTACSSSDKLAQCPSASALIDTATMPLFEGSPPKLAYTVYIMKARRDCDIEKTEKHVSASVTIDFRAARINAGAPAAYTVPYFVAISTEGRILAKRQYATRFTFDAGQTVADFSETVSSLSMAVSADKRPAEYGIVVGFQLTKAQLEYNRRAGRYAP